MTKTRMLVAVLTLSTVGLAACERPDGPRAVAGLCPDFKVAASMPADAATPVDNCVKRWAYTLAGTRDDAVSVADAVVTACSSHLTVWNQASLNAPNDGAEAVSVITGETTNALAEHHGFAESHALLYVLQARAGKCAAPAVKDGVPVGL